MRREVNLLRTGLGSLIFTQSFVNSLYSKSCMCCRSYGWILIESPKNACWNHKLPRLIALTSYGRIRFAFVGEFSFRTCSIDSSGIVPHHIGHYAASLMLWTCSAWRLPPTQATITFVKFLSCRSTIRYAWWKESMLSCNKKGIEFVSRRLPSTI